jgi:hypothetical protein
MLAARAHDDFGIICAPDGAMVFCLHQWARTSIHR